MTDIKALVDALASSAPDPAVKLRQGVVQSIQTGSLTLTIGGSATTVSGIKYLSSYTPTVNDTVWLATDGRDWMVIGKLSDGSGGGSGGGTVEALPAGSIIEWTTTTAPANWLICDGAAVSRTTYASLFAVIGTTYGAGNGTTTFNLPDLRGRVPVGVNGATFGWLGSQGGSEAVSLTTTQLPAHNHTITLTDPGHSHANSATTDSQGGHSHTVTVSGGAHTHILPMAASGAPNSVNDIPLRASGGADGNFRTSFEATGSGYGSATGTHSHSTSVSTNGAHSHNVTMSNAGAYTGMSASSANTGGGGAHNNLQPYLVVNYIIKYSNGDTAGDSQLTQRVSTLEAVPPFVHLDRTTTQSIPDNAYTAISWNSEANDNANMWSSGTNITVTKAGIYSITASVSWPNSTTGSRTARILRNGTAINSEKISPFNGSHWNNMQWIEPMAVGDVITVDVLQNTGAALNVSTATIAAIWVGKSS